MTYQHITRVLKKMCLYISSQHNNMKNNNLSSEVSDRALNQLLVEMSLLEVNSMEEIDTTNTLNNNILAFQNARPVMGQQNPKNILMSTETDFNADNNSSSYIPKSIDNESIPDQPTSSEIICVKEEPSSSSLVDKTATGTPEKISINFPLSSFNDEMSITENQADQNDQNYAAKNTSLVQNNSLQMEQNNWPDSMENSLTSDDECISQVKTNYRFGSNWTPPSSSTFNAMQLPTQSNNSNMQNQTTSQVSALEKTKKKNSCSVCGKMFRMSHNLKQHMKQHTGEKPYQCKVCGAKFAYVSNYNVHLRMHSGERPFSCPVCNKGFINSSNLKVHLRVHTREKPYQCTMCGEQFAYKVTLQSHINMLHSNKNNTLPQITESNMLPKPL